MGNHAVTLKVTPSLRIECKFWLTDEGWNGSCEQPSITVQAGTLNTRSLKWNSRSGNMLSPFCGNLSEQVPGRLLKSERLVIAIALKSLRAGVLSQMAWLRQITVPTCLLIHF